jgi:hypothetical protein
MEGMSIIHDASGCTGNYTGFDEPRWYDNQQLVFCSGLREMDAVLGDDDKLIQKIIQAAKDLKPQFITVLGSPVPMVIGSDLEGIAKEIEYLTGIPTLGFNTTGLQYYDHGISEAYLKVAKTFLTHRPKAVPDSVNLLGVTPLDFSIHQNIEDLQLFFEDNGYTVNACWSMGCNLETIKQTTRADCNVVVSASALKLAKYLEKNFQMPYSVGLPVGKSGEEHMLKQLKERKMTHELSREEKCEIPKCETPEGQTLIIGEQVLSNSIRDVLRSEYGKSGIDVATFFMFYKELAQKNDFNIENEMQLINLFKKQYYTTIIGDPLIKALLPKDSQVRFIELPHVAVSSKLYWQQPTHIIGNKIYQILRGEREIL